MILTNQQRVRVFMVGCGLGCVLAVLVLRAHGWPARRPLPDPNVARRAVPGILSEWTSSNRPVEGTFVVDTADIADPPNPQPVHVVVVPGLDPGSYVRVEEEMDPEDTQTVHAWKFMFADQVRVQLQPQADTAALATALRAHGWSFAARDPATGWVTIHLNAHTARAVPDALQQLQAWPDWVKTAEPDNLPPPEPQKL